MDNRTDYAQNIQTKTDEWLRENLTTLVHAVQVNDTELIRTLIVNAMYIGSITYADEAIRIMKDVPK